MKPYKSWGNQPYKSYVLPAVLVWRPVHICIHEFWHRLYGLHFRPAGKLLSNENMKMQPSPNSGEEFRPRTMRWIAEISHSPSWGRGYLLVHFPHVSHTLSSPVFSLPLPSQLRSRVTQVTRLRRLPSSFLTTTVPKYKHHLIEY